MSPEREKISGKRGVSMHASLLPELPDVHKSTASCLLARLFFFFFFLFQEPHYVVIYSTPYAAPLALFSRLLLRHGTDFTFEKRHQM